MKAPTAFTTVWLGVLLVTAASIHVHPDTNRSRMEANSSTSWTLVFRQTVPYLFSSNQWSLNSGDSSNANYAILDQLENYRGADGKFTFKLNWPGSTYHGAAMLDQIWKQSLNPVGSSQASSRPVAGYEAVSVPYTGMYWGGLEGGSSYALLDGSVASQLFFYTVGLYQERSYGIPCAASTTTDYHLGCSVVELYVGGTPSPTSSPTPSPTPTPATCPVSYQLIGDTCFSNNGQARITAVYANGNPSCQPVLDICSSEGATLATKEQTELWRDHGGDQLSMQYGLTSTMNGSDHWFVGYAKGWYAGYCNHHNRYFVCAIAATVQAPAASATGDPHLQNIHGERFDLMRPGNAVLIQIPRGEPVCNMAPASTWPRKRFGCFLSWRAGCILGRGQLGHFPRCESHGRPLRGRAQPPHFFGSAVASRATLAAHRWPLPGSSTRVGVESCLAAGSDSS
ncbi:unnamed protein product [Prorocentrum cordatum]|uniref:Uncharacterized protein n=1 Tax=Prorocentrum cordatum TaxID=2364126 RepID=A0ABN9W3M8_9DINO|nr:unnamed protein product [Polarella glacialis]